VGADLGSMAAEASADCNSLGGRVEDMMTGTTNPMIAELRELPVPTVAAVNGAVAGGGTIILRDGIAGLFGASTLPGYRKRGVQAALLESRIARAAECGCDLVVCLAQPGSTSQRNVMRRGFSVLYTRVKFEREVASSSPAPSV